MSLRSDPQALPVAPATPVEPPEQRRQHLADLIGRLLAHFWLRERPSKARKRAGGEDADAR